MDLLELRNRFTYHPPSSEVVKDRHEQVRELLGDMAYRLEGLLPDSREKSTVMTKLEEAMFWANAAIARYQDS